MFDEGVIIKQVKVDVADSDLRSVKLNGREDIFENDEVLRLINDKDGRIASLDGKFRFEGGEFKFGVSYIPTEGFGRIKMKKSGKATGSIQKKEDAFERLYDLFEDYFVTV